MLRDLQGCELELDTLKSKKSVLEHQVTNQKTTDKTLSKQLSEAKA